MVQMSLPLLFTSSAWHCWPLALILPRGTLGSGSHFYSQAWAHLQCREKREKDAEMRTMVDPGEFRNARLTILDLEVGAGRYGLPPSPPPPLCLIDYILQTGLHLPM